MIKRGTPGERPRSALQLLADSCLVPDAIKEHGKGRFPLVGAPCNAHSIIHRVMEALRLIGWSRRAIEEVRRDMTSSDYDHLLRVAARLQHPVAVRGMEEYARKMTYEGEE